MWFARLTSPTTLTAIMELSAMNDDIYIPFTYHIAWTSIDKHYYGVRHAKGCQPRDLWTKYFTSSKLVAEYRLRYGEPDIIEIRKTFDNANYAVAWEHKVLKRLNVLKSDKWLNQCIGGEKMLLKEHTPEAKAKISASSKGDKHHMYGKKHTFEAIAKNSASNKGKTKSLDTRARMSASKKGEKHPNFGKKRSLESVNKQITSMKKTMANKFHQP